MCRSVYINLKRCFKKYKCDAVCVANLEVTKCLKSGEDGGKWIVGAGLEGGGGLLCDVVSFCG